MHQIYGLKKYTQSNNINRKVFTFFVRYLFMYCHIYINTIYKKGKFITEVGED